jgi:hypothetical protein
MIPGVQNQGGVAESGLIQGGFGKYFMVQTRQGVVRASKAFSCLVQPLAGDRVALQRVDDQLYILAILERDAEVETRLVVAGDLGISSTSGKISIRSAKDLQLSSAETLGVVGKALEITALDTRLHSINLELQGERLSSSWKEVRSVSDALHLVATTLTERFRNAFRKVDGVDQQTSANYLQQVDQTLSVRSHNAVITSRKDIKIDGERIHMG